LNNVKIEVLSPIHIGDNDTKKMSSFSDFIIEDDKLKLVDHTKLENIFTENQQFMEDYIKDVREFSGRTYDLARFLKKYKIQVNEIASDETIPIIGKFSAKEIHPFISENGKKYLPGSTIKGAIRNALAFIYLVDHPKIIEKLSNANFTPKPNPKFNDEKKIFGENPFNDILKFLQVSDSEAFSINSSALYCNYNYHLKEQKIDSSIPLNYECIKPDSETEIRLKINENIPYQILKIEDKEFWSKHLSISEIFAALNSLSIKFIERELEEIKGINDLQQTLIFYKKLLNDIKNSNNKSCYFCIGKGTTIMEKTMLLAFTNKELHNIRNKMKNTKAARNFGWKFVKGKGMLPLKLPVTRVVFPANNGWQAGMGWLKMEEK
jgi:CRISPR-associated protein Csm5